MRKYIPAILLLLVSLFLMGIDMRNEPFGTYLGGEKSVTLGEVKLYKRVFGRGSATLRDYIYPLMWSRKDEECFERIAVEAKIARMVGGKDYSPSAEELERLDELKQLFLDEMVKYTMEKQAEDVTKDELKAFYEERKNEYRVEDRIQFRMVFKEFGLNPDSEKQEQVRKEAEALRSKAPKNPEDFGKMAREHSDSQTAQSDGRIGWISRNMKGVNPEVFDLIFHMKEGQVSELVELPNGYAFFLLEEKKEEGILPFDKAYTEMRRAYIKKRGEDLKKEVFKDPDRVQRIKKTLFDDAKVRKMWEFTQNGFWTRRYIERKLESDLNESDFLDYYHTKKDFFKTPHMWDTAAIVVKPDRDASKDRIHYHYAMKELKKKAAEIKQKALEDNRFEDLAEKYSDDPSGEKGGYVGWVSTANHPVFPKELKGKAVGEIVGPIEYDSAWWILKVLRIREPKLLSFTEVRDKIATSLQRYHDIEERKRFYDEQYKKTDAEIIYDYREN